MNVFLDADFWAGKILEEDTHMMVQAGMTTNFIVLYDNTLSNGLAVANGVLDYCEYDLVRLSMLFGGILPPVPITINCVPGAGGASWGGTTMNLYVTATSDAAGAPAIVDAELAEMFMSAQGNGWIPNWSNGEALSRVLATVLYPNRIDLFSTANFWINSARNDWVDNVDHSDQHFDTIGCGALFLYYLANQLNYKWPDIIAAGAPTTNTLAETATVLGVANAYTNFFNLLNTYYPDTSLWNLPNDNPYPLGPQEMSPILYIRHNLADDGTSHTGSLADSPDIIAKNNPVANPQGTYSTPASIASDAESDPNIIDGQTNYVYLRVWNRGQNAHNVFAAVYWSPPATLVTPNMWNLIGYGYYPDVPAGQLVQVSNPGITWPADLLPGPGHNCFVATVGNAFDLAPTPPTFPTFNDFVNYIYANNNITWRNFNTVAMKGMHHKRPPFDGFVALPFHITGAWDKPHVFNLETLASLPQGSRFALQVPHRVGMAFQPGHGDREEYEDPDCKDDRRRLRIRLSSHGSHDLGKIELPANTKVHSHLLVDIPVKLHTKPCEIAIRQLYNGREVGRVTWRLVPYKHIEISQ
jgi:hypothetical protein